MQLVGGHCNQLDNEQLVVLVKACINLSVTVGSFRCVLQASLHGHSGILLLQYGRVKRGLGVCVGEVR